MNCCRACEKCLSAISLEAFLLMIFGDKIKLNGKEKGGRNLVIHPGVSLVATLTFSLITFAILSAKCHLSTDASACTAGAQICRMPATAELHSGSSFKIPAGSPV